MNPAARDWLERFARHLASERRLSAHTASAYSQDLAALSTWCETQGLADWVDIDSQRVRSFAARSHAGGLATRTRWGGCSTSASKRRSTPATLR